MYNERHTIYGRDVPDVLIYENTNGAIHTMDVSI